MRPSFYIRLRNLGRPDEYPVKFELADECDGPLDLISRNEPFRATLVRIRERGVLAADGALSLAAKIEGASVRKAEVLQTVEELRFRIRRDEEEALDRRVSLPAVSVQPSKQKGRQFHASQDPKSLLDPKTFAVKVRKRKDSPLPTRLISHASLQFGELSYDWVVKESNLSQLVLLVGARDHAQGFSDAMVTLLEYGDFECLRCTETFRVVKEITRWLRGELYYVFRHFPAANKQANVLSAAEAAEAAGAQGRFWEMHEVLCEHSPIVGDAHLKGYAQELGLDVERFERERREHTYLEKVREDLKSGLASGVTQTPTFFINGVRYRGEVDLDSLLAAIEEAGNRAISTTNSRERNLNL